MRDKLDDAGMAVGVDEAPLRIGRNRSFGRACVHCLNRRPRPVRQDVWHMSGRQRVHHVGV